jgi:hypothetical protein
VDIEVAMELADLETLISWACEAGIIFRMRHCSRICVAVEARGSTAPRVKNFGAGCATTKGGHGFVYCARSPKGLISSVKTCLGKFGHKYHGMHLEIDFGLGMRGTMRAKRDT